MYLQINDKAVFQPKSNQFLIKTTVQLVKRTGGKGEMLMGANFYLGHMSKDDKHKPIKSFNKNQLNSD